MSTPRLPSEARPSRMGPLARLPVFFDFKGKRAIVAGDNEAVVWKAELLSACGAEVHVFQVCSWDAPDFEGAAIAVGSFSDEKEAARFSDAAREAGVPVNIVDNKALSDFSFGSIVNRSPLVIGISTDGAAPALAQSLRAKLEAFIPQGFARWAEAARAWRDKIKSSGLDFTARREFWRNFGTRAMREPNRSPEDADYRALLRSARGKEDGQTGRVILVGAGPGDPELLTLAAVRALQAADVILIDDLVAPEILDFARREAKRMMVGKTGFGPSCRQDDINALMVSLARRGKCVVRLKGGDPLIFGRAAEEIAACRAAGVSVDIIPGISAAQGAASRLGIPLTDRSHGRRMQFISGHGKEGSLPHDIDWKALADPETTTAIYMPVRTLSELATRAMEKGLAPSTPAIAVSRATQPGQSVIATTAGRVGTEIALDPSRGPWVVLLGQGLNAYAATERESLSKVALPRAVSGTQG